MEKIKVEVKLKTNVMDPQGLAVMNALKELGLEGLKDVRIGKVFDITFEGKKPSKKEIENYCDKLLANPVIENFEIIE